MYSQKKELIISRTDNTLIVNNIVVNNNPVSVNELGGTSITGNSFHYSITLSDNIDDSIIEEIRQSQSQAFGLAVERFSISATAEKRSSSSTYEVTVNGDASQVLSPGSIVGIVIGCLVGIAILEPL